MAAAAVSSATPVPFPRFVESGRAGSIFEVLEHLRSTGKNELPKDLTVSETDRSTIRHDEWKDLAEIPVIDLSLLETDRAEVVKQMRTAATEWGFFQILNHGLPLELLTAIRAQGLSFFELPSEIKNKAAVSEDGGPGSYSSNCSKRSFSVLHWAESLAMNCQTVENFTSQIWPDGNQEFRDTVTKFSAGADLTAMALFELIAESLGLSMDFFSRHYDRERVQGLRWHYYPACPNPSETLGASSHTDATCLTLLLQDDVGGLQIEKDGQWVGIKPIEGALVVNLGDTLHAWSNGICKSVLHRVAVNKEVPRISIAAFMVVDGQLPICPPDELIDESHPRQYKTHTPLEHIKSMLKYKNDNIGSNADGVVVMKERFKLESSGSVEEIEKAKAMDVEESGPKSEEAEKLKSVTDWILKKVAVMEKSSEILRQCLVM